MSCRWEYCADLDMFDGKGLRRVSVFLWSPGWAFRWEGGPLQEGGRGLWLNKLSARLSNRRQDKNYFITVALPSFVWSQFGSKKLSIKQPENCSAFSAAEMFLNVSSASIFLLNLSELIVQFCDPLQNNSSSYSIHSPEQSLSTCPLHSDELSLAINILIRFPNTQSKYKQTENPKPKEYTHIIQIKTKQQSIADLGSYESLSLLIYWYTTKTASSPATTQNTKQGLRY